MDDTGAPDAELELDAKRASEHFRFVLVRPSAAENVGAVARTMANFGFRHLAVVAPECNPRSEAARRIAVHAHAILDDAVIYPTLSEAVGDCCYVAGTAARTAGLIRSAAQCDFDAAVSTLCEAARTANVAVVFGPERTGLENVELACCHGLTTIQCSPDYPVLNLSHAAAIFAHAIFLRLGARPEPALSVEEPATRKPATMAEFERMSSLLHEAARRIGFLRHDQSGQLMGGLRRVLLRAVVSKTELQILIGLARQILWHCNRHSPPSDGSPKAAENQISVERSETLSGDVGQ